MGNEIAEVKTIEAQRPDGPLHAIMIAANILDPTVLDTFVGEIVEAFKAQRMLSPPTTTHFLLSVRGETTADAIKALWVEHAGRDQVLQVFMSQLLVADVVRAERTGPAVEQVSLLS